MNAWLLLSYVSLWALVLFVGFLLFGALQAVALFRWQLEQLEATTPRRLGRDGLKRGKMAPDFSLPSAAGPELSLHDFAGRKVLLVFTQSGCGPCHDILPELNRLHDQGQHQVVIVNNGDMEETRRWAAETRARFPVLAQERFSLSKRYQVFATPFAFLMDEKGIITSKGIVGNRQYLGYVLTGAGNRAKPDHEEPETEGTEKSEAEVPISSTEVSHV